MYLSTAQRGQIACVLDVYTVFISDKCGAVALIIMPGTNNEAGFYK